MQSHLVGRRAELAHLRHRLDLAADGAGGIVLISGEAGVGKTRLAGELACSATMPVLQGRAEQGRTAPYAPLVDVLRKLLHARPQAIDGCGPLRPHLAQLMPELGASAPDTDRATLFEAVRCAFAQIERALVVLEDLQWSDEATLELLAALARPLAELPVLVLCTYRSDGLPRRHGIRRLRNDLRRAGHLDEVDLRELDRVETADLLAQILGAKPSASLVGDIHDRTAGVPFFVEELAAAIRVAELLRQGRDGLELVERGDVPLPATIRDAVLIHASELTDAGRRAAEVAAVAGDGFDLRVVAELADEAGLDELLETGLVHEDGAVGRFRHALTCEALYADIPWTARRRLHLRIAEQLEQSGAPAGEVAPHWTGAREDDRARDALLTAAHDSEAVYAYRDAAEQYRQALDGWADEADPARRATALAAYARCCELAGDLAEAARSWRELIVAAPDPGQVARAQRELAAVHELRGEGAAAVKARLAAATAFSSAGRPVDAVAEHIAVANHHQYASRHTEAIALAVRAQEDARGLGRLDLCARAMGIEGMARAKGDDYEAGLEIVRAALGLALEHDLTGASAELYQQLSVVLYHAADYPGAEVALDTAVALCDRHADPELLAVCQSCLAYVLLERGEWPRAVALCRTMLDEGHAAFVADGVLGAIHAREGKLPSARRLLTGAIARAEQRDHYALSAVGVSALARVAAAEGDDDQAGTHARALLESWRHSEDGHYAVSGVRWAAGFFASRGDRAGANACADGLTRIASSGGHADALAALAFAIGECALLEGDGHTAAEQLGRALELHQTLDMPFERAEIALRAGVALEACGERELALERLTSAHRLARTLGARPLAAAAAAEVEKLGESVRTRLGIRAAADVDGSGLTPRERDVLRLVAVGHTNREIARELVLSQRTVDMHVRNVLRKLDCRSRVEATVRALELGLSTA